MEAFGGTTEEGDRSELNVGSQIRPCREASPPCWSEAEAPFLFRLLPVKDDREKTRGTEVRSTNSSVRVRLDLRSTMCSCSFGFVLLRAVSSNPPPPPRLLPVAFIDGSMDPSSSAVQEPPAAPFRAAPALLALAAPGLLSIATSQHGDVGADVSHTICDCATTDR